MKRPDTPVGMCCAAAMSLYVQTACAQDHFSDQVSLREWARLFKAHACVQYITYAEAGGSSGIRLQMEEVLGRFPDGYSKKVRVFELASGLDDDALRQRAEICAANWDSAESHSLDFHVVPGSGQAIQRLAGIGDYTSFPGMNGFDAPRDGFAAVFIAHKLTDEDPVVRVQDTNGSMLVDVPSWHVAFDFDRAGASEQLRLVAVNSLRGNGELGMREVYSEFKAVGNYPVAVPFRREVWVHEGSSIRADGTLTEAGLRKTMTNHVLTFVPRNQIENEEFAPSKPYRVQSLTIDTSPPIPVTAHANSSFPSPVSESNSTWPVSSAADQLEGHGRGWMFVVAGVLILGLIGWLWLRRRNG